MVHARTRQTRELTHEELLEAAAKFLPPLELEDLRVLLDPQLARTNEDVSFEISQEQQRIGTTGPIDDNGEWRKTKSDEYAQSHQQRRFDEELKTRLYWPLRHPEAVQSARYRDPAAFGRYLAESDLPARTVFTLVLRNRAARRLSNGRVLRATDELHEAPCDRVAKERR